MSPERPDQPQPGNANQPEQAPAAGAGQAVESPPRRGGLRGWWAARSRWQRRTIVALPTAVLLYTLGGFFGVPLLVKHVVVPQIGKRMTGTIGLRRMECNPYTFRLLLEGLEITDGQARRAIALERFETNFELWRSIFKAGLHFQDTRLVEPFVGVHVAVDGSVNLANLFKPDPDPRESEPMKKFPHLVVDSFRLSDGELLVEDLSLPEPFSTVLGGLNLTFDTIDTSPDHLNPTHLVATTETGARIEWTGSFKLDPLSSDGTIRATDLAMARFMPYALRFVDAGVVDGRLGFTLEYEFVPVRPPKRALLRFPILAIDGLAVLHDDQPLATFPRIEIESVAIDGVKRALTAKAIRIQDGSLLASRGKDEVINLAALARPRGQPDPATAPPPASAAVAPTDAERRDPTEIDYPVEQLLTAITYLVEDIAGPWEVAIEELSVTNQAIDLQDLSLDPAVHIPLRQAVLRAGPVRSEDRYRIPFLVTTRLLEQGSLRAEGVLGALDGTLDAKVTADDVELVTGAPYLRLLLSGVLETPTLRSGHASFDLHAVADIGDPEGARFDLSGLIRLREASLVREDTGSNLLSAELAVVEGTASSLTSRDGRTEASWTGTLDATGLESGESLMRSLGLGDGDTTIGSIRVESHAVTALGTDGSLTAGWEGAIDIEQILGRGLAISGPVDVDAAAIRIEGKADAIVRPERPVRAEWVGVLTLDEGSVALRAASLDARLAMLRIDGSAAIDEPGPDDRRFVQRATWSGTIGAESLEARLADAVSATLSRAEIKGDLRTLIGADDATAAWNGSLASSSLTLAGSDWSAGAQSLRVDGEAFVDRSAPQPMRWDGSVSLENITSRIDQAGGIETTGERMTITGRLHAEDPDLASLSWQGSLAMVRPKMVAANLAGPTSIALDSLKAEGDALLDRRGSGVLTHEGPLELVGARVLSSDLASGLDIGLRAIHVAGALRMEPLDDAARTTWRGQVQSEEATLRLGGGSTVDLLIGSLGARGALTVEPGPSGPMTWDGEASLASVSGTAAESNVGLGAAEAKGTLAVGRGAESAVTWTGTAVASDARSETKGASESITVRTLDHQGSLRLVPGDPPALDATGVLVVEETNAESSRSMVAVPRVRIEGIDLRQGEGTLAVRSLAIESPSLKATSTATSEAEPAPEPPAPASLRMTPAARGEALAAALPFRLNLELLTLTDGRIEIVDGNDPEALPGLIDSIDLQLVNVATDGSAMSELTASARVQGSGRFQAAGTANIFENPPSANIEIALESVPLPPLSPLSGRFAGFKIDAGRLNVGLPIAVDAGKVQGNLDFQMDRLKLGEKVRSPDAPNIPIDLGLALLRDANDQIKGGVPFSGDMTNPDFSFGGLIWQAVLSLFGKIVTAPFTLIAGIFAGGQDLDLSYVAFPPGSADLDGAALTKLDVLAKGLEERPTLRLEIDGQFAREADIAAIRPMLLREEALRRLRSSFPSIQNVPEDVYRQIVLSRHAELPAAQQAPRQPNGDAPLFEQAERVVLESMEVTDAMLADLARRRAESVRTMLTAEKGIAADRVEVVEGELESSGEPQAVFRLE